MAARKSDLRSTVSTLPRRPEPPAGLSEDARALWRSIVQDYPPRHFRGANLRILEVFCRASSFAAECDRHIETHGLTIQSGEVTKANPSAAMRAQAWTEMRNSAAKLRLTISSTMRADSAKARPSEKHALAKPWESA